LPVGDFSDLTFDFTRANAPAFDALVSQLVNSQDEVIHSTMGLYQGLNNPGGAAAVGILESDTFGHLFSIDTKVELIRLHLDTWHNRVCLDFPTEGCGFFERFVWEAQAVGDWQIFGPIPEPSTAALCAAGLLIVIAATRRVGKVGALQLRARRPMPVPRHAPMKHKGICVTWSNFFGHLDGAFFLPLRMKIGHEEETENQTRIRCGIQAAGRAHDSRAGLECGAGVPRHGPD
jgi:hypothetical protein